MSLNSHRWSFSTVGGVKRVNLETGEDLVQLANLDPKLWTALSCPIDDLEIDKNTLALIDTDKDGQIRVPEVIAAVAWISKLITSTDVLLKQEAAFHLSLINESTDEGRHLKNSALVILKNLGKAADDALYVEDTSNFAKIFEGTAFNGDGIITEDSCAQATQQQLIRDIINIYGGKTDRGGKAGVDATMCHDFFAACANYADWLGASTGEGKSIFPLGDATENAFSIYQALKAKIDDYFVRCKLAQYDDTAIPALNVQAGQVESISNNNLTEKLSEIANYPIAKIFKSNSLLLNEGINPAWDDAVKKFKSYICQPLLNHTDELLEEDWLKIKQVFDSYTQWLTAKPNTQVETLGMERIRAILNSNWQKELEALFAEEQQLEEEANHILKVDQLVRYHRDLFKLLKNFVTFYDFYAAGSKAIFQAGTLYIDQRSCDLCIQVKDLSKHAVLASFSGMYLIYCDCTSKATNEKMTIVAGLTNGDVDNLVVGRNALFYDRHGLDWDATIIKIIENPISIRQAFFSPYRKLYRFIETQINKMASAEDDKTNAKLSKAIEELPEKAEEIEKKNNDNTPFDIGKFVGIFAAIGLALGAIGAVFASIISGFLKLSWWKMPIAISALLLVISGPAMIIAWLKLRKRSLAPLLEANGWAINSSVKINIHFGKLLTQLAELPKGASINYKDPLNQKKFPILPLLIIMSIIAVLAYYLLYKMGSIHF